MSYVQYNNDKQIRDLNLNVTKYPPEVFPYNIYKGSLYHVPEFFCDSPRDPESMFIYPNERQDLPDRFARFNYMAGFYPNGIGIWPGRYQISEACDTIEKQIENEPKNMAPPHIYTDKIVRNGLPMLKYIGSQVNNSVLYNKKHLQRLQASGDYFSQLESIGKAH
jgi:hypothetical protein